jgi:hypothetical protein
MPSQHMKTLCLAAIALCAIAPRVTFACSCVPDSWYFEKESFAREAMERQDFIIHARVTELLDPLNARIEVIEVLKGPANLQSLKAQEGPSASCGTQFQVGEEKIFMSSSGSVNLCQKLTPDPRVLESLRKYRP